MRVGLAESILLVTTAAACGGRVGTSDPGSDDRGSGRGDTGGGASGGTGATGGIGGSPVSGGGGSGTSGAAGSGTGGTSPPPSGRGNACWSARLRDVAPKLPTSSIAPACMRAGAATGWSAAHVTNLDAGTADPRNDDAREFLVGRWIACSSLGGIAGGIEFGANGRWRFLIGDGAGGFLPVSSNDATTRGFYALLGQRAQLNIRDDTRTFTQELVASANIIYLESLPEQESMRWTGQLGRFGSGPYARAEPSPLNGWDNPPSLTSGACSLVGTWDTTQVPAPGGPALPQQPMPASISFDDAGNFVAAPQLGVDLCTTHTMYGTYALSSRLFQLTSNVGMGVCSFWFDAGYGVTFSADCTRVSTMTSHWDNCTGGRGYFNSPTTLVKRP